MSWNPELYHKFQEERSKPFKDLKALIDVKDNMAVIDLGCGTGELTSGLKEMLPGSTVLGIDSSPEMLEEAKHNTIPGLTFKLSAIEEIYGEWDLIFSNAAIQWLPEHHKLIPKLISHLKPGGQITIQLPSMPNNPEHDLILGATRDEPYASKLQGWTRSFSVLKVREYAALLYESGAQDIVAFEKVYPHVLQDSDAILDWVSATAALPYFERLPTDMHEGFRKAIGDKLRSAYPGSPVFFPFNRILFSARKPG